MGQGREGSAKKGEAHLGADELRDRGAPRHVLDAAARPHQHRHLVTRLAAALVVLGHCVAAPLDHRAELLGAEVRLLHLTPEPLGGGVGGLLLWGRRRRALRVLRVLRRLRLAVLWLLLLLVVRGAVGEGGGRGGVEGGEGRAGVLRGGGGGGGWRVAELAPVDHGWWLVLLVRAEAAHAASASSS